MENVKMEGFIYDKVTKKPLPKAELNIVNWYYEGGDYDSYNKKESCRIFSDENGYYSVTFKKSAFLEIDVLKKDYKTLSLGKEIFKKRLKEDFYMEK